MKKLEWNFEEEEEFSAPQPVLDNYSEYIDFNEYELRYYDNDNGQKKYESYYLNNKLHREDGPAIQEWYENGQKKSEEWFLNGKKHREDGPAIQWWFESGQKYCKYWYLNGQKMR